MSHSAVDEDTPWPAASTSAPDADLALKRRLAATRWPDKETVADRSQGAPLARLQELVRHWGTDYDWRKAEARLNALPQFVTAHRRRSTSTSSTSAPAIRTRCR